MADAPILSWEGLGLQQGGRWLFRELDLHIGPRDRLALIGRNGAGKTTLFRLIADQIEADKGKRSIQPGTKVVLLEQEPDLTPFATLMDFALAGENAPQRHEVEIDRGPARHRHEPPRGDRQWRREAACGHCPRAGDGARPAAARRADQPPRPRRDRLARDLGSTATRARSWRSATTAHSSSG